MIISNNPFSRTANSHSHTASEASEGNNLGVKRKGSVGNFLHIASSDKKHYASSRGLSKNFLHLA